MHGSRGIRLAFGICLSFLLFQNCIPSGFKSQDSLQNLSSLRSNDGQVFDGKLRILHHIVDNYSCEGHLAPESVLMRDENLVWHWTKNIAEKCASEERIVDSGVVYDDATKTAVYAGLNYIPPKPYFVLAAEDPNLSDVNLMDGICADINGQCSLRAAIEQSVPTSLTSAVVVNIPAGTYKLTDQLDLWLLSPDSMGVKVLGESPLNTILDGDGKWVHFYIRTLSSSLVSVENLTLQNGFDRQAYRGSSIQINPNAAFSPTDAALTSQISISNCILKNNLNAPAIYAHENSGSLQIHRTQVLNTNSNAIQSDASNSLLVEDSFISKNNGRGIVLNKNTAAVMIRNSTFADNYEGINFLDCKNCEIENVTVTGNSSNGVIVTSSVADAAFDLKIRQATIFGNAFQPNQWGWPWSNLSIGFVSATNSVLMTNSILAMPGGSTQPNCMNAGKNPLPITALNSLASDSTCSLTGTGNMVADPLLAPLADNGGWSPTMLLLPGSPALNAGQAGTCTATDERGVARGGPTVPCDIGAVEMP